MRRRKQPKISIEKTEEPKAPTKKHLIEELRTVYKTLNRPFDHDEYDEACSSDCTSGVIEEVFGSWEKGLDKAGLIKKFAKHQAVLNEKGDFDPTQEVKKAWKQEKKKLLDRAEATHVKKLKTQTYKVDLLKEMLAETMSKVEPLEVRVTPKTPPKKTKASKTLPQGTLWLEFSDLQLGTLITKEELGGLNEHNWGIWQTKIGMWKDQAIENIEKFKKSYNIDRVVISCLGDMVEGQDIFKGQKWQLDKHVVDQAMFGADDTAAAFAEVFGAHPDIHFDVFEVFGNHGRIGMKGDSPYSCSMDRVYQRFLEARLQGVDGLDNYKYHTNDVWFYLVEIYGWNHLLLHGDQGMSGLWSNRPTVNGLEKGIARYNQMLQQQIHFLHIGHFHTPVNWSFNISQILINGSFIGTSNFSATKLVASTPPVQLMYLFTPKVGLDITQRIYLTEEVIDPIKPNVLEEISV